MIYLFNFIIVGIGILIIIGILLYLSKQKHKRGYLDVSTMEDLNNEHIIKAEN